MDDHVVNSRRANLRVSLLFFNSMLEKEAVKLDSIFHDLPLVLK